MPNPMPLAAPAMKATLSVTLFIATARLAGRDCYCDIRRSPCEGTAKKGPCRFRRSHEPAARCGCYKCEA